MTQNSPCPFGPQLQHYWDRLSPLEQQMRIDIEGLYSLAQQSIMDQISALIVGDSVIDAFCGVGGSAIGLARAGKKVISIDSNAERIEMAKYNATLFGVSEQIEFMVGNSLKLLPTLHADAIFLDPPWGGPDYSKQRKFYFKDFAPNGRELLEISLARARQVSLRLPKNFEMAELEPYRDRVKVTQNYLGEKLMHFTAYFEGATYAA
ncbi:MAG: RsmD family RNA methyltransferase [Deltaproteobacteria bacterium]|nr:RsmD family RNA methyltransferase [Deltaproteobacteria bacterium]